MQYIKRLMTNKTNIAIIPARMASSRFPNKPMAKINGKPMIGHVFDNTRKCNLLFDTFVATCDHFNAKFFVFLVNQDIIIESGV